MSSENKYIAIDLKSFYASVECVERGLDPLDANLVVADESRTAKTICLAVSPSLKAYGISGRARLFEVIQETQRINNGRRYKAPHRTFSGKSYLDSELKADSSLELDYVVAPPRMAYYIEYSTKIYEIYLKYIAPEDICVYSIDEVFIDATHYLKTYKMTAHELAMTIIQDVLKETGITATAGIGTNLYLAKVAMDVEAKHIKPDKDGVRIAELDEMKYRRSLWTHRPITDFWRVGKGYAKKLEKYYMYTMGDVARCSINDEEILYRMFGVNAELLIDHAWGWEPCTMADIKAYKPETNSISSGQVLQEPYPNDKARLVVREMAEALSLDLVGKKKVTDQIVLTIGYDIENVGKTDKKYKGEITVDRYGRKTPKHAHGTGNIGRYTASTKLIINTALDLFDRITDQKLTIRRITIVANHVIDESDVPQSEAYEQLGMFTDYDELERKEKREQEELRREKQLQEAMLNIKKMYGKNSVLRGTSYKEGATAKSRNKQIGGHKA